MTSATNAAVKQWLLAALHLIWRGIVISFELQLGGTILLLHAPGSQFDLMLFSAKRHLVGKLK